MKNLCYNIKMRNNSIFLWGIFALFSGYVRQNEQISRTKMRNLLKSKLKFALSPDFVKF